MTPKQYSAAPPMTIDPTKGYTCDNVSLVCLEFNQTSNATTWTLDPSDYLPFGGNARTVSAVVTEGEIKNSSNARVDSMPYVNVNAGSQNKYVQLVWPQACRGTVHTTIRVDKPL